LHRPNRGARTPACRVETLLDASSPRFTGRRQECRRGTQECVRHIGQQPNVKLFLRDPLATDGHGFTRIVTRYMGANGNFVLVVCRPDAPPFWSVTSVKPSIFSVG